jgi:hypothetical protein
MALPLKRPLFFLKEALYGGHSRGVAQPGSATVLGTVGREFESLRPDHFSSVDLQMGPSCPIYGKKGGGQ